MIGNAVREIGVSEVTFYHWRKDYGRMKADQLSRLKEPTLTATQARVSRKMEVIDNRPTFRNIYTIHAPSCPTGT